MLITEAPELIKLMASSTDPLLFHKSSIQKHFLIVIVYIFVETKL